MKCRTCGQKLKPVKVGSKWKSDLGLLTVEFVTDDGEVYLRNQDGVQDSYECLEYFHSECCLWDGAE